MKAIHLPTLRRHLFVNDRCPDTTQPMYWKGVDLYATWSERHFPECRRNIVLMPNLPKKTGIDGKVIKTAKTRLFVECPCGRLIPVGRLSQHKCPHNK